MQVFVKKNWIKQSLRKQRRFNEPSTIDEQLDNVASDLKRIYPAALVEMIRQEYRMKSMRGELIDPLDSVEEFAMDIRHAHKRQIFSIPPRSMKRVHRKP